MVSGILSAAHPRTELKRRWRTTQPLPAQASHTPISSDVPVGAEDGVVAGAGAVATVVGVAADGVGDLELASAGDGALVGAGDGRIGDSGVPHTPGIRGGITRVGMDIRAITTTVTTTDTTGRMTRLTVSRTILLTKIIRRQTIRRGRVMTAL
jgi:hypothetical protein